MNIGCGFYSEHLMEKLEVSSKDSSGSARTHPDQETGIDSRSYSVKMMIAKQQRYQEEQQQQKLKKFSRAKSSRLLAVRVSLLAQIAGRPRITSKAYIYQRI